MLPPKGANPRFWYLDVSASTVDQLAGFNRFQSMSAAVCAGGGDDHVPIQPCPVSEGRRNAIDTITGPRRDDSLLVEFEPSHRQTETKGRVHQRTLRTNGRISGRCLG